MRHPMPPFVALAACYALAALLIAGPAVAASDPGDAVDPSTPGALQVTRPGGTLVEMPLRHTRVVVDVTAFVARATIEQTFANPFREPVEAVYTFPLGDRAAVDDYEFVVGDRVIRGEIKRREEARQIYEDARAEGYQAALLEQERPNIFTQSIANLEPGKEVKIRIRTVETLRYEKGVYRLTFPLVVGPRYIPGGSAGIGVTNTTPVQPTSAVPDAPRITPPVLEPGFRSGHDVDITVRLDAGVPMDVIESPSHRIDVTRPSASSAVVRLGERDTIPNKDFLLRWNVASDRPAVAVLAHRTGLDGFFTLLVQPKGEIGIVEAAPKEIILVLDTSGSMQGVPLDASKRFAKRALQELGPRDTFNLVEFASGASTFAPAPVPNTRANVWNAVAWIDHLQGGGGTEMLAGFRAAFDRPADPSRLRMVVFMTDGYIGNEDQIFAAIGPVVGQARIHTLGIGSSVNHYLLDRMAELGQGSYVFIRPDENADEAVDRFKSWVTKPYLTDLAVDWGALPVADISPERFRDLGSGQTLTLVGRYVAAREGDVVVRGRLAGAYWEQRVHVVLPERETRHEALGPLWARGRIEELLMSSPGQVPDSIRAAVTALALEYRLMSPFTSFVAVDSSRVVNPGGNAQTVHQTLRIPDGVSFEGVFGKDGPAAWKTKGEDRVEDQGVTGAVELTDVMAVVPVRELYHAPSADESRVQGAVAGGVPGGVPGGVVGGVVGGIVNASPPRSAASPASLRSVNQTISAGLAKTRADSREADRMDKKSEALEVGGIHVGSPDATLDARARILDAALRVLADLADDGKLSAAEGKPALAALLAAQQPSGAVSESMTVQAVAAWALAEAAAKLPRDPWVTQAATKAANHMTALAKSNAKEAAQAKQAVRDAMAAAKARLATAPGGRSPFERLVATIGKGHLTRTI